MQTLRHSKRFFGALALALIVAHTSSFTHFLLVRHAICFEHGLPVHLHEEPRAEDAGHAIGRHAAAAVEASARAGGVHEHEHCAVAAHRRESLVDSMCNPGIAPSAPAARLACVSLDARSAIELMRLAPKHSPPAV